MARQKTTPSPGIADAQVAAANLALIWDQVRTPDPAFTKQFNRAGFKGTATNAAYLMRLATERFGPCGMGWGFVITNEDWVEGHVLRVDEGHVTRRIVHVIRGHIWYLLDGERYQTGEQFGQTDFVGSNKNGLFTDEEAPKKSITDCMSKCFTQLGFAADIHMGLWDDNKYVNEVARESAAPAQNNRAARHEQSEEPTKVGPVHADDVTTLAVNLNDAIEEGNQEKLNAAIHAYRRAFTAARANDQLEVMDTLTSEMVAGRKRLAGVDSKDLVWPEATGPKAKAST